MCLCLQTHACAKKLFSLCLWSSTVNRHYLMPTEVKTSFCDPLSIIWKFGRLDSGRREPNRLKTPGSDLTHIWNGPNLLLHYPVTVIVVIFWFWERWWEIEKVRLATPGEIFTQVLPPFIPHLTSVWCSPDFSTLSPKLFLVQHLLTSQLKVRKKTQSGRVRSCTFSSQTKASNTSTHPFHSWAKFCP